MSLTRMTLSDKNIQTHETFYSYSRQVFIYLDPILIISVFESTAYLKFAKLQYVPSGFRCRVITGSLMRLY